MNNSENPQLTIPCVSGSALIANFMYPNAKNEYESGEIEIEDGIYKKATLIFGNSFITEGPSLSTLYAAFASFASALFGSIGL